MSKVVKVLARLDPLKSVNPLAKSVLGKEKAAQEAAAAAGRGQKPDEAIKAKTADLAELKDTLRSKAEAVGATRSESDFDVLGNAGLVSPKRKAASRVLLG